MKRKWIKASLIVLFIVLLTIVIALIIYWFFNNRAESRYQHDADIVRLNHLFEIAKYIEEYKEKTGEYPFVTGSQIPSYTYLAIDNQKKYIKDKPPYEHTEHDVSELKSLLESGLGKKVEIPFDPQRVPVYKPNFYIYMTHSNYYVLAIHLYNEFSFTQKINHHYNKLQVSNNPNGELKIWSYSELINNDDFNKAIKEKKYKEGYFEQLEKF